MKIVKLLCLILACCTGTAYAQKINKEALRKLQLAELAIANLYVDTVDENNLVETAIVEMLKQLDPHSTYNNPEEVKEMNEPLQGNFEGIGVQFQMVEDTLLVVQPVSNGPSEKAGILAGDRIVAVNDSAIAGVKMSTEAIMKRLRGPKNSTVKLTIVRREVNEPIYFQVKRDRIPIHSLDAAHLIEPHIGYIRINRFAATTGEEFLNALKMLQKKGMKDLILDLQGNGGGYLNAAIDLANEFLNQRELIVYTQGRNSRRKEFLAKGNGHFKNGRLIVLVDEYSASASEIVTGAIQDWDRGIVVGRRTFGKGLVQRPIDLPDGSMMRLTVARYYTPSDRCIQKPYDKNAKSGEDMLDKYHNDLINRLKHGELMHADSIHFPDSLKYHTKKLGRTVYGGGGIMPDIFVPIDTTRYTDYHRNLMAKGAINKATMKYIERYRKPLQSRYKKFDTFLEKFHIDQELLDALQTIGEKEKVTFDETQYQQSLPLIKVQLKALIARDLWDMNEYFQVMNTTNESVLKALQILHEDRYRELF